MILVARRNLQSYGTNVSTKCGILSSCLPPLAPPLGAQASLGMREVEAAAARPSWGVAQWRSREAPPACATV